VNTRGDGFWMCW